MTYYPLLDIKQALVDADRTLADVVDDVYTLLHKTDGHCPRQADLLLANIVVARALLAGIIPPQCQEDIAREQALYDQEESLYSE